jgi:hypothetical protein
MEQVAPERRHGGDAHGEDDGGGFSFPLENVDGATRMEAPTPTRGAPATLQQIPAAALLPVEAALESEAKVATLQETYEDYSFRPQAHSFQSVDPHPTRCSTSAAQYGEALGE